MDLKDYLAEMITLYEGVARTESYAPEQREANVWSILIEALLANTLN